MFEKIICFGDIHFGEKQNSDEHNQDCIDYIKWMIETAKEHGITECVFLGDWHHSRHSITLSTLAYSIEGLELINDYFEKSWFIEGNHDLLYRASRDVSSVIIGRPFNNIEIISEPTTFTIKGEEVALIPWLVGEEWKSLKGSSYKYVFGHFELPTFLLNAMVRKPDKGELNKDALANCGYVFSGHFHKRQIQDNIHYIGNPFGHNFNDVDDTDRGCMILEWDKEPVYINWEDGPVYRRWDISELIDDAEAVIGNDTKIFAEIFYGDGTTYSQASYFKEELEQKFNFRRINLKGTKTKDTSEGTEITTAKTVTSVDNIVVEQLKTIDSTSYDNNMLIEEYLALDSYDNNKKA